LIRVIRAIRAPVGFEREIAGFDQEEIRVSVYFVPPFLPV
jgi:hypothetical protein